VYRGQCAELCGKDHGFMPIVVNAVSEKEYEEWLVAMKSEQAAIAASSNKEWTKDELMEKGASVYAASCAACHGATGAGVPPVFPPMTNSPVVLGDIAGHIDIVMNGKTGTAMQAFKGQLSDVDLAAVITYERNAMGNSVGDLVQPSTIKSLR
jgi:cytochrome c oxidase subunit 2